MKRLVLLGGGHAHVQVLKELGERPDEALSVSLVTPRPVQVYSGMIPGVIAGHYTLEQCSIDLVALAGRAHAAFLETRAVLVNPDMREVILADSSVVGYDVLSIDVGSQPVVGSARGVGRHAIVLRPLEDLVAKWEKVLAAARGGAVGSVTVVGAGAGGVEIAFAIDWRLRSELGDAAPHVRVITDTPVPMPDYPASTRTRLRHLAIGRGIGIHTGVAVAEVGAGFVRLASGLEFASDATFWATGAGAPDWLGDSGLRTDARGFLAVDDTMQSVSHPGVFGAGDCATNERRPRAKAGVFAVRAGPALASNLRAALAGGPLAAHVTSPRFLALLSAGGRYAVGSWGPFSFEGGWAWRWKDRIDRGFVARYAPPAPAPGGGVAR